MQWEAIVDFDGTISLKDTTDALLERFARPGWTDIEDAWVSGLISARECMERQVALLDMSQGDLDDFIADVAVDWDFRGFVRLCERRNIRLHVVSDGLDRIVAGVLRRIGLDRLPVSANRLEAIGQNRWRMTSPHAAQGCPAGTCKCAKAKPARRNILVGDGRSDFCLAGEADHVFAKSKLLDHCRTQRLPVHPFADFSDVAAGVERLLAQTPAPASLPAKQNGPIHA